MNFPSPTDLDTVTSECLERHEEKPTLKLCGIMPGRQGVRSVANPNDQASIQRRIA